ncbi:MAG TPA: hypothetical protein VLC53_15395 [Myxococcota bacterium]|nr:hypothetical protein [Myxococcota bacterium]
MRALRLLLVGLVLTAGPCARAPAAGAAAPPAPEAPIAAPVWVRPGAGGESLVGLWFFWTRRCPHCHAARPALDALREELPWLELHSVELDSPASLEQYRALAAAAGGEARAVPAFVYCGRMRVGFDPSRTPALLRGDLERCRTEGLPDLGAAGESSVRLPGGLDPEALSLPLLTVVLAGLDSFNPCAFFVLLVLLGLLVRARSRARMLAVGGVFVALSGLVYFAFMAAWLNLFLVIGERPFVTTAAGLLAVAVGAVDLKDFVWRGRGPSRSIPDSARPGLFRRMRALVSADRVSTMLLAAAALAIAANAYEALCTAGLPMVFTRLLTLRELPPAQYYLWLALYNVVYVLPMLAIVAFFAWTLGAHRLSEREGRLLKLLSGLMMFGLGIVLLAAPASLARPRTAIALLVAASAITAAAAWAGRARSRAARPG